jgi:hypothetical protein
MAEKWDIYDYLDHRGKNVIAEWMDGLQKKDRARLQAKIDLVHINGPDLPTGLLSDTSSRNIKKIRVNGDVALRPMLCRGPLNMDREYTLLCGAIEKDRELVPKNAVEMAEGRREEVIAEPAKRRVKRDY